MSVEHAMHLTDVVGTYLAECPDCNRQPPEVCSQCHEVIVAGYMTFHVNDAHSRTREQEIRRVNKVIASWPEENRQGLMESILASDDAWPEGITDEE